MVVQQPHGQPAEHTPSEIEISVYHQRYRFLLSNASENQLIFDEYSTYLNTKVKNIFHIKKIKIMGVNYRTLTSLAPSTHCQCDIENSVLVYSNSM